MQAMRESRPGMVHQAQLTIVGSFFAEFDALQGFAPWTLVYFYERPAESLQADTCVLDIVADTTAPHILKNIERLRAHFYPLRLDYCLPM
jgi:hypothetical protein